MIYFNIIERLGNLSKMGDTQDGKTKNPYFVWSPQETKTLLGLLVNGINQNWTKWFIQ